MKYLKFFPEKCDGEGICEKVCSSTFFKKEDREFSAIQIAKIDGKYDMNACNQCGECINICPVQAISRNKMGTVVIDKNLCVGCFMCVGFCPSISMRRADDSREPFKCISCGACVRACPNDALELVESDHTALPQ